MIFPTAKVFVDHGYPGIIGGKTQSEQFDSSLGRSPTQCRNQLDHLVRVVLCEGEVRNEGIADDFSNGGKFRSACQTSDEI